MEYTFTEENFATEVTQSAVPVLVDFWAPWCGPCQMMGPIVEELAQSMDNTKMKIGKINVDENGNLSSQFQVMSIPTFIVFKNGQEVDRAVGGMSKEKLKALVEKHL